MIPVAQIITRSAVKTISENAYNNIFENIRYADSRLNSFLEDASAICLAISSSENIIIRGLEDDPPVASYRAFEIQKETEAYLRNIIMNKNHILMAAVIGLGGKSFQTGGSLILKRVILEPWFMETLKSPGTRIFYNTPEFTRILICRPVIIGRRIVGAAIVEMDFQVLNGVYASAPLAQSQITVFDETGGIVFTNYGSADVRTVSQINLGTVIKSDNPDKKYRALNGEKVLIVSYCSSFNKLTTLGLITYANLVSSAWHINSLMLVIIAAAIAAAALASWVFSMVFCKKIYLLQHSMMQIHEGNMEIRSQIRSRDEIGIMSDIFNNMMDKIALLLKNIRETEEQKRQAEQIVLESQIQPHFIYNTINSIAYTAHEKKEKELEAVASATVELLRGVLGVRESLIPFSQEYHYIEQYLVIQRFKMGNDYRLDWDVEAELWLYPIPKLILQPIVENALLHGIGRKKNGRITVQVYRYKEILIMKVTDNGNGMDPQYLDAGNVSPPETKGAFRKVGLTNVRERIALIYGEPYGVKISSEKGAFTSVELRLPYREENL